MPPKKGTHKTHAQHSEDTDTAGSKDRKEDCETPALSGNSLDVCPRRSPLHLTTPEETNNGLVPAAKGCKTEFPSTESSFQILKGQMLPMTMRNALHTLSNCLPHSRGSERLQPVPMSVTSEATAALLSRPANRKVNMWDTLTALEFYMAELT